VYEVLGRVPRNGERLTIGPFRVIVERMVRRKIQRLYFERADPVATEQADAPVAAPAAPAPRGRADAARTDGDRAARERTAGGLA
jgi:hypothetical protein